MLEKMGWQPGKGLGANESGITEHVKVSYKHDTQGKTIRPMLFHFYFFIFTLYSFSI